MKRKMTKIIASLLAIVLTAAMIGCGGKQDGNSQKGSESNSEVENGGNTETKKSNEKVHITYTGWGSADEKATENAIINEFMKLNEDIEVELIFVDGNYEEKLQILIAGGEAPDVMSIGSAHIPSFGPAFAPLDKGLGSDANYISSSLRDALVMDGEQYALPKRVNTKVYAYNKNLLEQAGVQIPGADYTIEQFTEDAQKIAALGDDIYGSDPLWFGQWIYQFGGKMMDENGQILFNSKEGKEAAQYCIDAVYKYKFAPTSIDLEGSSALQWFIAGKVGFKGDFGPYFLPTMSEIISFDWDVCAVPGQGGEMEIVGVAMSKTTKYPEAAQRFIEFVSTSKEAQSLIGGTSALPVTEDGKVVFLNQYPDKNLQAFFDAMTYGSYSVAIKGGNQIGGPLYGALFDRTLLGTVGNEDISVVLDEAAKEAQEVIDEARK